MATRGCSACRCSIAPPGLGGSDPETATQSRARRRANAVMQFAMTELEHRILSKIEELSLKLDNLSTSVRSNLFRTNLQKDLPRINRLETRLVCDNCLPVRPAVDEVLESMLTRMRTEPDIENSPNRTENFGMMMHLQSNYSESEAIGNTNHETSAITKLPTAQFFDIYDEYWAENSVQRDACGVHVDFSPTKSLPDLPYLEPDGYMEQTIPSNHGPCAIAKAAAQKARSDGGHCVDAGTIDGQPWEQSPRMQKVDSPEFSSHIESNVWSQRGREDDQIIVRDHDGRVAFRKLNTGVKVASDHTARR